MKIFDNIKDRYEDIIFAKRDPVVSPLKQEHFELNDEDLAWKAHSHAEESLEAAKGSYNSKVHRLPQPWRMIHTLVSLDMDVNNGGFHQFFTNAGGRYDSHIQQDVQYLGHTQLSDLFNSVWKEYAAIDYSDQWENRGKSWEYFTEAYKEGRWEEESMIYYREVINRNSIMPVLGAFIRAHPLEYTRTLDRRTEQTAS
jgi:hypothetical protein